MRKPRIASKQSAAIAEKEPDFPPEISALIVGRTVHLSEPERFLAQEWKLQMLLGPKGVTEVRPDLFELEPSLFASFLTNLRANLTSNHRARDHFRASDWIAFALIATAGRNVEVQQLEEGFTFYDDDSWTAKLPESAGGSTVEVNLVFRPGPDVDEAELVIELGGTKLLEALWDLGLTDKHSPKGRLLRKQAQVMWRFVTQEIAARLGIEGPGRGRPRAQDHAAWLHDHFGLSWQGVAKLLCPENHKHGIGCRDKYRKQAKLYWKRERQKYEAMAPAARGSS
jgi:hypothetical protein